VGLFEFESKTAMDVWI